MVRSMNVDSAICDDISVSYTNIDHLLECKYRHLFTSELIPKEPKFNTNTQYLVEILHIVSPVWFEVRIHKYKDAAGEWCNWNFAEHFEGFNEELKKFYTESFAPVKNISDVDKTVLYVLRKGEKFMRCIILDIK